MIAELQTGMVQLFMTENRLPVTVIDDVNEGANIRILKLRGEATRYVMNVDPSFASDEQLAEHVKQAVVEFGGRVGLMPNKTLLWYVNQFRKEMVHL